MPYHAQRGRPWVTSALCAALMMLTVMGVVAARNHQEDEELHQCTRAAEPLVKDPDNIFPLTPADVERVCSLWRDFRLCVQRYTSEHLTEAQQREFQAAVGGAFQSVEQLCRPDPEHTRAYLENAPCLKRVSLNTSLCGRQYTYLVDLAQGLQATDAQMCCAHLKFRECVLEKTERECDGVSGASSGRRTPSDYMRSMLDRTLGFFLQTCKNYVPNAHDCPRINFPGGSTVTSPGNELGNINNNNNHSPNNHLRPDATTSSPFTPPPAITQPSTRFTWTTPSRPTTPSLAIAGNNLLGPESSQYKGSGTMLSPALTSLVFVYLALRLH